MSDPVLPTSRYYTTPVRVDEGEGGDGVPFLGVCVGMQLLADFGEEVVATTPGLGGQWITRKWHGVQQSQ